MPGKLDGIAYEELRKELAELPRTWYPDLIRALVEAAIEKQVFRPGGATRFVRGIERKPKSDKAKS